MRLYLAAIALPLVFAGCGGGDEPGETGIDWSDYPSNVKVRIDDLIEAGDCDGLQVQFDNADEANDVELMSYLDSAMQDAGCY